MAGERLLASVYQEVPLQVVFGVIPEEALAAEVAPSGGRLVVGLAGGRVRLQKQTKTHVRHVPILFCACFFVSKKITRLIETKQ